MSYEVFARKYRPKTFDDVLGQDHVVRTLRNAIEQRRLAHAYLFVGPRGTGKTSTARILAKALNCPGGPKVDFDPEAEVCRAIAEGRSMDVLEIDGASNNGVEQVRDLRSSVSYAPMEGQFRIFYIDEVHMLTTQAFNALLKTLEEPPAHVKFIFATTEAHKILPTIISRCQRFDLRRIPDKIIAEHLLHIAQLEQLTLDPAAAFSLAKGAEGGMRDAQSMLDQMVAFCGQNIREEDVLHIFGFTAHETVAALASALLEKNTPRALDLLYEQAEAGKDLTKLLNDLMSHFRAVLVAQADPRSIEELSPAVAEVVQRQLAQVTPERLLNLIDQLAEVDGRMKWAPNKRLYLEIGFIKAIRSLEEVALGDVIAALHKAQRSGQTWATGEAVAAAVADDVFPATDARGGEAAPAVSAAAAGGVWPALQAAFRKAKPLLASFLDSAALLGEEGPVLTIGFAPTQAGSREALARPAALAALEAAAAEAQGRPTTVRLIVSAEVVPVAPPVVATPAPAPVAPPPAAKPEPAAVAAAVPPTPAVPEVSAAEKEFYDDPLIKAAMEVFEATVISITPTKRKL